MRMSTLVTTSLIVGLGLSACSGSQPTATPGLTSASGISQPTHRVKPDFTSTSVTIINNYSSEIFKQALSASCLSGTPPSSIPANTSASPFTVSYNIGCTQPSSFFDVTYGPTAASGDQCTFNIGYTPSTGVFSYGVTNGSNTNCSTPSTSGAGVTFKYSHM
jgi:hypothetical protein